jgi:hypothetical protein
MTDRSKENRKPHQYLIIHSGKQMPGQQRGECIPDIELFNADIAFLCFQLPVLDTVPDKMHEAAVDVCTMTNTEAKLVGQH